MKNEKALSVLLQQLRERFVIGVITDWPVANNACCDLFLN